MLSDKSLGFTATGEDTVSSDNITGDGNYVRFYVDISSSPQHDKSVQQKIKTDVLDCNHQDNR
eukprot:4526808-Amphidinium_carterae.1